MAIRAGRHHLGTDQGRIVLTTVRVGLAAQAGHDLTLEFTQWSGDLAIDEDQVPTGLDVRVDTGSLVVREGSGGLKPLTDRDRREIAATARKILGTDRHPEATFTANSFEPAKEGGGLISGTLTLAGRSRPLVLNVSQFSAREYRATASVTQSDFGIKPYSGFFGSLKIRDAVDVQVEVSVPHDGPAGAAA